MSNIDGSPGFTQGAFDALRQKAAECEAEGNSLVVGLIFDEMSTRRQSQWDRSSKQFQGHITSGRPVEYEDFSPLSKDVLLLMVSGISKEFKIPIGYFLTNGIKAEEKVAILNEAMHKLSECNVKLASTTCDGAAENIRSLKNLGVQFDEGKPYFRNPHDGSIVFVLLDPPHMIKLIRNCLGRLKEIIVGDDYKIKWKYIQDLVSLQISQNINLCNKLTKTHVDYENVKMRVRIAAETISNSTASAIEFLDTRAINPNFSDSAATVKFIRTFNNLFDAMNTKLGHTDDEYKRPISEENINQLQTYFDEAKNYIKTLKVKQDRNLKDILKSNSYVPFFGFLHNMTSFMGIYNLYIKPNGIEKFYTFAVSQDHVECFFGCIRRMGGNNCNPNAQQFSAAYRKLLFQNEVSSSDVANCQNDITKILELSSGMKKINLSDNVVDLQTLEACDGESDAAIFCGVNDEYADINQNQTALDDNYKAYLASVLQSKVIRKITLKGARGCVQCLNIFGENDKTNDIFIEFLSQRKNILQPCKSTIDIIRATERLLERYESQDVSFLSVVAHILKTIDMVPLYVLSNFGEQHNHKFDFIKFIIEEYLDMRCMYESKLVTRMAQKKLLRNYYLKEVHRQGQ